MVVSDYNDNVFINCPFDQEYKPLFDAIVFAVFDCGFLARSALEEDDAGEPRFNKIVKIISECRYGIHDLSRTEPDPISSLPRFNMPLELGIFLGCSKFGSRDHKSKKSLIIDTQQYRYQQFISDLSGQDIRFHNNNPRTAKNCVRDWLRTASRRTTLPGIEVIWSRYQSFRDQLPAYCNELGLDANNLIFIDYCWAVTDRLERIS